MLQCIIWAKLKNCMKFLVKMIVVGDHISIIFKNNTNKNNKNNHKRNKKNNSIHSKYNNNKTSGQIIDQSGGNSEHIYNF